MCVCSHPIRWYRCVDCPTYQEEEEEGVYLQPYNWGVKVCQCPGQLPCNVLDLRRFSESQKRGSTMTMTVLINFPAQQREEVLHRHPTNVGGTVVAESWKSW